MTRTRGDLPLETPIPTSVAIAGLVIHSEMTGIRPGPVLVMQVLSRISHQPVTIVIAGTEIVIENGNGINRKDPGIVNGIVNGIVACLMHLQEA